MLRAGLYTLGIAICLVLLCAEVGEAQPYFIEMDLDGQIGNGPGTTLTTVGQMVNVDVWVTGGGDALRAFDLANSSWLNEVFNQGAFAGSVGASV